MNKLKLKKFFIYFFLITIIFALDRITKIYILNLVEDFQTIETKLTSFLNLYLVWNKGIGFGLFPFNENTSYNLITIIITAINLILIVFLFNANFPRTVFFSIILGGSLGNLFDRLYYSAVPDFIDLHINNFHWFIFNVADIFITIGVFCLILLEFLKNKK